ncbi:hypothetical protein R80B4_02581 [Fibrobacteres bacterium R8-0-B4]
MAPETALQLTVMALDEAAVAVTPVGAAGAVDAAVDLKFAVSVLFAFIVTVNGFAVPVSAVPVQLSNVYPLAAVAVTVTRSPDV